MEHFEIGDCDAIPHDLPNIIRRLFNLKNLRLENCVGKYTREIVKVVQTLKKLRTLELININLNDCLEDGIENCDGITAFLIIPSYNTRVSINYCYS